MQFLRRKESIFSRFSLQHSLFVIELFRTAPAPLSELLPFKFPVGDFEIIRIPRGPQAQMQYFPDDETSPTHLLFAPITGRASKWFKLRVKCHIWMNICYE